MQKAEQMELIPCLCGKKNPVKALFHCWSHESEIVAPSITVGGHGGGVVSATVAIVELGDGQITKYHADHVRFIRNADEAIKLGFYRSRGRNRDDLP